MMQDHESRVQRAREEKEAIKIQKAREEEANAPYHKYEKKELWDLVTNLGAAFSLQQTQMSDLAEFVRSKFEHLISAIGENSSVLQNMMKDGSEEVQAFRGFANLLAISKSDLEERLSQYNALHSAF